MRKSTGQKTCKQKLGQLDQLPCTNQLNIDQRTLSNDAKLINVMKNLSANNLDVNLSKNKWVVPKPDVDKAFQLLVNSPPEFPVKYIQIPGGVDIVNLCKEIRWISKRGKKKWNIVISKRSVIVPSNTKESEVTKIIEKYKQLGHEDDDFEDEELTYLGDISYCGEVALLSTKLVNVYKSDRTVQSKNFCRACIRDGLIYALGNMFDDATDTPAMKKVYENIDFIPPLSLLVAPEGKIIPIGQLIWAFIADNDIAVPARTYITAIALQTSSCILNDDIVLQMILYLSSAEVCTEDVISAEDFINNVDHILTIFKKNINFILASETYDSKDPEGGKKLNENTHNAIRNMWMVKIRRDRKNKIIEKWQILPTEQSLSGYELK